MLIVGGYNREDEFISDSAEVLNLSPDLVRQHLLYHMFFLKKSFFCRHQVECSFPRSYPLGTFGAAGGVVGGRPRFCGGSAAGGGGQQATGECYEYSAEGNQWLQVTTVWFYGYGKDFFKEKF